VTTLELQLSGQAVLTFSVLTAAIVGLWLPRHKGPGPTVAFWQIAFLSALVSALAFGFVSWAGFLALLGLALAGHYAQARTRSAAVARLLLLLGSLALAAHLVPGFENPRIIDGAVLSEGGIRYTKYLNFDKGAVGLLLLAFGHELARGWVEWGRILRRTAPVALGTAVVLMALSFLFGYARWDPGWPPILLVWAWTNLFFTCVAEEAVFRGLIQRQLSTTLASSRFGPWLALSLSALLFGLAHYAGGPKYVLLSTLAGLGYGWAFMRTDRIEASIATHFFVNFVHFTLFTYPALAPVTD